MSPSARSTLCASFVALLALASVACGGGKPAAKAPAGPKSEAELHAAFVKGFHDNVEKTCACHDDACLKEAHDAIQALENPTTEPTPEEQAQLDADTKRLEECSAAHAAGATK